MHGAERGSAPVLFRRNNQKVSSDYHVRFDNAYYSVDKAYIHKPVNIRATADVVKIYSQEGVLLCEWPRATFKGEWKTNRDHLPPDRNYSEWNSTYFIRKAATVGPDTVELIKRILKSRKLEVQTYRMCVGVLGFTRRYSKAALEETCHRAIASDRTTYSFIKNSISAVAEELGDAGYNSNAANEKNAGAYVMSNKRMEMTSLLEKSRRLAEESAGKEAD